MGISSDPIIDEIIEEEEGNVDEYGEEMEGETEEVEQAVISMYASTYMKKGGKNVKLVVREEFAEVQVIRSTLNIYKETKKGNEGLPPRRRVDHKINLLPEAKPVNQRPYIFSYFQKLEIEKIIEELIKGGLIQESDSPYASPVLLVKKKDGGWRMCIDYRQLNTQTVKNKFPILIIEDILDELKGAEYFTKIDLRSGYHQIRMHEGDIHKTTFRTHQGHYEFLVTPFGLTNVPVTFQSLMNQVFKSYLRKFILVFFDDILIYNDSLEEHNQHLKLALETLRQHQLFAKRSKCEFGAKSLEYLGHEISSKGVATDPKKIEAMVNWSTPKTVREMRGFLCLTGYYRRFVKGYSVIAKSPTTQLKKNAFGWNKEAEAAFKKLKQEMVTVPVLAMPDFSQPFILETDASDIGMGAVLMQGMRPIAYMSKCLGAKNQGLSTYEKEFSALLTAVQKWRHYLIGKPFGVENKVADALSRVQKPIEVTQQGIGVVQAVTELVPTWMDKVKESYEDDAWIQGQFEKLKADNADEKYIQHQGVLKYKDRLCVGRARQWR
ncbi:hypothetical protein LUZ63_015240 [Rhynchospora breviuscula]|uniref:Reverse transcriptase domain-containing protein n=1 Tax=Rhynchospora breviuscula TaxID=2022672 RepID=A0A9Q0CC96_9POAL|nr:hypothetical protein LUZ63_015240 [Rhynchospora breviuscula]